MKFLAILLFLSMPVTAQQAPKNICKEDPRFKQWDFWVGNWKVIDNKTGKPAGSNLVTKTPDGCVIKEHWTNMAGQKGFSMNYFNPNTAKWRQIWVSGPGYRIDYEGELNKDGAIALVGFIEIFGKKGKTDFRGTWSKYPDGSVRQFFEQKGKDGKWQVWFDGKYVKVKKEN